MKPILLVVLGPTASGKTALGIELARQHRTEILSADSRQFYREMNIGVAKPSDEELAAVPHHFVNSLSIYQQYSAGDFERDALALLEKLFQSHETVLMVGGSGLFIKAVTEGLDHFPEVDLKVRKELNARLSHEGLQSLSSQLAELDPASHQNIALDNPRRVMRALEVSLSSGKPYSYFKNQPKAERPFQVRYTGIQWPREVLYQRINARCDQMLEAGLLDEVRALYPQRHVNALQTVGYTEFFDYLDGKHSYEEAASTFKQHTRNYAKRQMTWFGKMDGVEWLSGQDFDEVWTGFLWFRDGQDVDEVWTGFVRFEDGQDVE